MQKRLFVALTLVLLLTGAAAAQKSFYNKEFKFGFKYPTGSKLKTEPDYMVTFEPMKGLAEVSFRKTSATATVAAAEMTQDACHALSTAEDDTPRKKKFGKITFERTEGV